MITVALPRAQFLTGAALFSGAIFAAILALSWAMFARMMAGAPTLPDLGLAALIGLVIGGIIVFRTLKVPGDPRTLWLASGAGFFLLLILTLAQPFGLSLAEHPFMGLAGTVIFAYGTAWSCRYAIQGIKGKVAGRLHVEIVLVRILKWIGLAFFSLMALLPFYVMVVTSLKTQSELLADPLDLSINFSQGLSGLLNSYWEVLTTFRFSTYILNSTIVSIATVILTLLMAIPGAYAVSRLRFPGRAMISRSILLIYMFPAIVLVIPLYSVFTALELRNTFTGLLVVYVASTLPVALYMLQGYFRSIPRELEEAGIVDGCTRLSVIIRITLPLSLPALASVSLYVFMIAWNEFLFAFMFLDDPDIFTLSRGIVSLNSSEVPRQFLMAGAVIVTVPVMVLFLVFERLLVGGLTSGSVKG